MFQDVEGLPKLMNEMLSLQSRVGKLLQRCIDAEVEQPLVYKCRSASGLRCTVFLRSSGMLGSSRSKGMSS